MVKKVFSLLCVILIVSFLLPGCSPLAAPAGAEAVRPPLKVEYTTWEGDYTLLVAEEKGFFEKHGVQVEPVYYPLFEQALSDFASRKIDVGLFSLTTILRVARVADVRGVMVYDSGGTSAIAARKDIGSIADLKGKKIGAVPDSMGEATVYAMLQSYGMSIADITLIRVAPEEVIGDLNEGLIDAGFVWSPLDTKAADAGYKILYSRSSDSPIFPDMIAFNDAIIKDRPDDVRAFLAAWSEAVDYRISHPQEAAELIAKRTNQNVKDTGLTGVMKLYNLQDNQSLFDPSSKAASSIYQLTQANLDFLISKGDVTTSPDLNVILNPSFLK